MSIIHLTEASPGAPTLSGTNGALAAILDWALVQNGWAIEFTSGNSRVYRPGTGNRFRMWVQDDSSVSGSATIATVRGCESASSATSVTDPFPTSALVTDANANWAKSSTASATARNYDIWVAPTYVIFFCNYASTTNVWEGHFFGDIPSNLSGDSYNTVCYVRGTTGVSGLMFSAINNVFAGAKWYWARSYDGTVKSTIGSPIDFATTSWGIVGSAPLALSGPTAGIDSNKVQMMDGGATAGVSATLGLPKRGWLPQFRNPIHSGRSAAAGPNARDVYQDTAYNASFSGTVMCQSNNNGTAFLVIEGDTWAVPSG